MALQRHAPIWIPILSLLVATAAMEGAEPRPRSREELQVVDCLLPGQVRKLGRQQSYLSQRRTVRTTALDCEILGGEYVAHDRAKNQTALRVWLD